MTLMGANKQLVAQGLPTFSARARALPPYYALVVQSWEGSYRQCLGRGHLKRLLGAMRGLAAVVSIQS
jgi:hypothetical protein